MKHAHRSTTPGTRRSSNPRLPAFVIVGAVALLAGCPDRSAPPPRAPTPVAPAPTAQPTATATPAADSPGPIARIDVQRARTLAAKGDALLVCAYDDDDKCRSVLFEGAITLGQLREREDTLGKDKELLFYCS